MLFTVLINMTIFVSLHWQFQIQNIFKEKNIFFQFPAIYTLYFEILKGSPLRNVIESLHTTMRLEAIRAIQMISYNFYILEIEHFSLQHNDWYKYKIKNTLCGEKMHRFVYTNNKNNRIWKLLFNNLFNKQHFKAT